MKEKPFNQSTDTGKTVNFKLGKTPQKRSKSNLNSPERINSITQNTNTPSHIPKYKYNANPESIRKNRELLKNNLSVTHRISKPKGDGTKLIP